MKKITFEEAEDCTSIDRILFHYGYDFAESILPNKEYMPIESYLVSINRSAKWVGSDWYLLDRFTPFSSPNDEKMAFCLY